MENFNDSLNELNFHDSWIDQIQLSENGVLTINIDYYNWEGNDFHSDTWITKKLSIIIEHCIHFKFSNPDFIKGTQEIHKHQFIELDDTTIRTIDQTAVNADMNLSLIHI